MRTEIPPGTLDMLILKSLARLGAMHGYGIALHIQQTTEDGLYAINGGTPPLTHPHIIRRYAINGGTPPLAVTHTLS